MKNRIAEWSCVTQLHSCLHVVFEHYVHFSNLSVLVPRVTTGPVAAESLLLCLLFSSIQNFYGDTVTERFIKRGWA